MPLLWCENGFSSRDSSEALEWDANKKILQLEPSLFDHVRLMKSTRQHKNKNKLDGLIVDFFISSFSTNYYQRLTTLFKLLT